MDSRTSSGAYLPDAWDCHLSALVSKVRALLVRVGFGEDIDALTFEAGFMGTGETAADSSLADWMMSRVAPC